MLVMKAGDLSALEPKSRSIMKVFPNNGQILDYLVKTPFRLRLDKNVIIQVDTDGELVKFSILYSTLRRYSENHVRKVMRKYPYLSSARYDQP